MAKHSKQTAPTASNETNTLPPLAAPKKNLPALIASAVLLCAGLIYMAYIAFVG